MPRVKFVEVTSFTADKDMYSDADSVFSESEQKTSPSKTTVSDQEERDSMFWFPDPYPEDEIPVVYLRRQDDVGEFLPGLPSNKNLVCQSSDKTFARGTSPQVPARNGDIRCQLDDDVIGREDDVDSGIMSMSSRVSTPGPYPSYDRTEQCNKNRFVKSASCRQKDSFRHLHASLLTTEMLSKPRSPSVMSDSLLQRRKERKPVIDHLYDEIGGTRSINLSLRTKLGHSLYWQLYNSHNLAEARKSCSNSTCSIPDSLTSSCDDDVMTEASDEAEEEVVYIDTAFKEGMSLESKQVFADCKEDKKHVTKHTLKSFAALNARNCTRL